MGCNRFLWVCADRAAAVAGMSHRARWIACRAVGGHAFFPPFALGKATRLGRFDSAPPPPEKSEKRGARADNYTRSRHIEFIGTEGLADDASVTRRISRGHHLAHGVWVWVDPRISLVSVCRTVRPLDLQHGPKDRTFFGGFFVYLYDFGGHGNRVPDEELPGNFHIRADQEEQTANADIEIGLLIKRFAENRKTNGAYGTGFQKIP